jgi:hypothetical protein
VCDPVAIEVSEAIEAPDEAMRTKPESVCAYCGNSFEMTPDRQRYCSPECYYKHRADTARFEISGHPRRKSESNPIVGPRKTKRKRQLAPDEANAAAGFLQSGTPIQSVARMYSMGSSGALLKELARHGLAS